MEGQKIPGDCAPLTSIAAIPGVRKQRPRPISENLINAFKARWENKAKYS